MKALKPLPFLFLVLCFISSLEAGVYAQEETKPGEYDVKAAFLVNFIKFVEWPESKISPDSTCSVCVLGNNPFGSALRVIQGKSVVGKRVITRLSKDAKGLRKCDVVFISSSEKDKLKEILEEIRNWNILTVGDMKDFARAGGVIQFIIEEDRVHFIINIDAADRAKLRVSSKLLRLSHIFRE